LMALVGVPAVCLLLAAEVIHLVPTGRQGHDGVFAFLLGLVALAGANGSLRSMQQATRSKLEGISFLYASLMFFMILYGGIRLNW
jgi:hypothetical protein